MSGSEIERVNILSLKARIRPGGGGATRRDYLDFVIDGEYLSATVGGDLISALGWLPPAATNEAVRRLVLQEPADFPNNRRGLYVCPECADLGCGAISLVIEEIEGRINWRDFGFQNNYEDKISLDEYAKIGPFVFDREQYNEVIRTALLEN